MSKENPNLTETLERDWLRVSADITFAFTAILADLPRKHLHNPGVVGQDHQSMPIDFSYPASDKSGTVEHFKSRS